MYEGQELEIAELIQQRRIQMLVHSCLYYEMDTNLITDRQWDIWAKELVQLQKDYPELSENVIWYDVFKDWDASTGAFLPLKDPWVIRKAMQLKSLHKGPVVKPSKTAPAKPVSVTSSKSSNSMKKRLF
jgi:hypothetical protein